MVADFKERQTKANTLKETSNKQVQINKEIISKLTSGCYSVLLIYSGDYRL